MKQKKGYCKGYCKSTKILNLIKENPFITQEELSKNIGIARKSIILNMKKTQENGLLKRIGADKNGGWQVEE